MANNPNPGLRRVTTAVGAIIDGVDLREPLARKAVQFIRQALLDHGVVFFHDQDLSDDEMERFAANFGRPMPEPFLRDETRDTPPVGQANLEGTRYSTAVWHSDTTFVPEPPMLTALRAVKLPPVGGDTCWASMYAAYDALSLPMRRMLDGLTAVHSMMPTLERMGAEIARHYKGHAQEHGAEHVHPLIRVHPETGRKALYYSEAGCRSIVELTPAESDHIIALLREHVKSPEFAMRWRWTPNDVALWDNRSVQHYAVPDYSGERVMQRVVLAGDRPRGPMQARTPAESAGLETAAV